MECIDGGGGGADDGMTKFEEVLCLCKCEFLNNITLSDIKKLRLVNKFFNRICNEYLHENRFIKLNISNENRDILWKSDSIYKFKVSALAINWRYGYEDHLIFPNQFIGISKLILSFDAGVDITTFDTFFAQLPNLNHFGFFYSMYTVNSKYWDTLNCYPNIETLEIGGLTKYMRFLNVGPLCNFIVRHPNVTAIHTKIPIIKLMSIKLLRRNITIEHLYLDWHEYKIHFQLNNNILTKWYNRNIYKHLHFKFNPYLNSNDDYYYANTRNIPGLVEIQN